MKKWLLRILLSTGILLLLLAAAVQVVLWTDMPKSWVLSALQEKLQLRVSAQHFSTGWRGRTELSGVVVSLPLEQEAMLQARELSIEHTSLLALLVGRPLRVAAITIGTPNLLVRQQADGRWNLEAAAELIRRAGGGKTPETQAASAAASLPQLPSVKVTDAVVRLVDLRGRQATLSPLAVSAAPQGPLVWQYDASIPGQLHVTGEVAPGGPWQHEAAIDAGNLASVVRPFLTNPSPPVLNALEHFQLSGKWSGRVSGSLMGRLDLSRLFLAGYTATGPLAVAFNQGSDGVTTLTPAGVVITSPLPDQLPPARIAGGTISLDAQVVKSADLTIAMAGGEVRLAGEYGWNAGEGKLQADWNNLVLPKGSSHGGSLTASIHQPWPNQPVIEAALRSNGRAGKDTWTAALKLDGAGKAWDRIDWKLSAPTLLYQHADQTYNLNDLVAALATRGDVVTLDSLSLPPGALYGKWQRGLLAASGRYHLSNGNWNVYLSGSKWPVVPGAPKPADFLVNLSGDRMWARLEQFFLDGGDLQLWADGDLSYSAKQNAVELDLYGWYPPLDYTWREKGEGERVRLTGALWSEMHLKGAWPLKLDITGTLYGKAFKIKDHLVGDVAVKIIGVADADRVQVGTTRMELLGGIWGLAANLRYDQWLTRLDVTLKDLSLAQLDNFAAPPPNLRGTFGGKWKIELPMFDANRMTAEGEYQAYNVGVFNAPPPTLNTGALVKSLDKPVAAPGPIAIQAAHVQQATTSAAILDDSANFHPTSLPTAHAVAVAPATSPTTLPASFIPIAEVITGKIRVADGLVTLDKIRMERKPLRGSDGLTVARLSFPIFSPRQMHLEASAAAWPLQLLNTDTQEISNVLIWAQTRGMDIDLQRGTASGPVGLDATIAFKDKTVTVHVDSQFAQRRLLLRTIKGEGLGGYIEGDGFIDLDRPLLSEGQVQWNDVDADSIIALAPALNGLGGRYSGRVRFSPTDHPTDRDATGPFAFSGEFWNSGGNWKGLPIGEAWFVAHGDYQPKSAATPPVARAVLDRLNWDLAGGNLKGWSRVTWYDLEPFLQVNLDFDRLSLDQIVKAARPAGQPHKLMPGLLSGYAMAAGNPFSERGQKAASGEAKVRLTESDLMNVKAVNLLYSIMSVQLGKPVPSGKGFIQARLEGQRLEIPALRYSNRGADIWANAAVVDVFDGAKSPIEGTAAGSVHPLRDLKLPFMADVDKIISALSGSVATVRLRGTVGNPDPQVIPFADSGETFRRFMIGEVKNEVRGTSGQ